MSIIIGSGPLSGRMPPAFENVLGSAATALRSAYLVMPHTPLLGSKYTGALARIHVNLSWGSLP